MEGELDENHSPSGKEDDADRVDDIHFSGPQNELDVFDDLLSAKDEVAAHFIKQSDKEWFKNYLSSSFSARKDGPSHPLKDFPRATINKAS